MAAVARVAWDDAMLAYHFGRGHPMDPVRLDLTVRLARALGLLDAAGVEVVRPLVADDELLGLVHAPEYVAAVRRTGDAPHRREPAYGLGTSDNPAFAGMHEASARTVGATVDVARAVWAGDAQHGVAIAGGLHHAMPAAASGFCVYNDVAVAIRVLQRAGAERIAYVDTDVHHGDGVQEVFWDDPGVLTISLHQSPRTLFPGTGGHDETGGPGALGSAVNVALQPGTGDAGWLRAFDAVVPPLLRAFGPQVLVTQHGCDSHARDPLAALELTVDAQRAAAMALHGLAHELAHGRWVATGGGGYAVHDVVPRTWSHLIAIAAERPVGTDVAVPHAWREHVRRTYGVEPPVSMGDGGRSTWTSWDSGYDPGDPLDRTVLATRVAVFPLHGLDPHF